MRGLRSRDDVDRHRFGVAEGRQAREEQQRGHEDGAEGVDVAQRIERESVLLLRGRVTEVVRHAAVAHLVQDHRGHEQMKNQTLVQRELPLSREPEGERAGTRAATSSPTPRCRAASWRSRRDPATPAPL